MMSDVIQVHIENRVATLTLNRPEKLNALNFDMARAARDALGELADNSEVGCVVLTGAGRAFCAGGDVSDMAADQEPRTLEQQVDRLRDAQELCWQLQAMPKITVAAINGYAMGAGLGITLSCDLRFASTKARLGTAYAQVALGGDYGTTWNLTRLVGPAKAKELFVLGEVLDADEACRVGLLNRVIDHERLAGEVAELAGRIAHGPLVSYRYMKENVNLAVDSDFRSILDREAFTHIRCSETEDHREGARAFVEKRRPQFRGR